MRECVQFFDVLPPQLAVAMALKLVLAQPKIITLKAVELS